VCFVDVFVWIAWPGKGLDDHSIETEDLLRSVASVVVIDTHRRGACGLRSCPQGEKKCAGYQCLLNHGVDCTNSDCAVTAFVACCESHQFQRGCENHPPNPPSGQVRDCSFRPTTGTRARVSRIPQREGWGSFISAYVSKSRFCRSGVNDPPTFRLGV